jgi:hypothetical protein
MESAGDPSVEAPGFRGHRSIIIISIVIGRLVVHPAQRLR